MLGVGTGVGGWMGVGIIHTCVRVHAVTGVV